MQPFTVKHPVAAIAVGAAHCLAYTRDNRVWAWGRNAHGELGNGGSPLVEPPVRVGPHLADGAGIAPTSSAAPSTTPLSTSSAGGEGCSGSSGAGEACELDASLWGDGRVSGVAAGGVGFSALWTDDGRAWTWGRGDQGQTGHGEAAVVPQRLEGVPPVGKIAMGMAHTLVLTQSGALYGMGLNSQGQAGALPGGGQKGSKLIQPTLIACGGGGGLPVADMAAGGQHSLVLTRDGLCWSFGRNNEGQLGLTMTAGSSHIPKRVSFPVRNGSLEQGRRGMEIAAGDKHSAFLTEDRTVWWSGALPALAAHRDVPAKVLGLVP